jgi:hypothetical protein
MSSRDKGLTKAEKRWQRHLREAARSLRKMVEHIRERKLELHPEINMLIIEHEVVFSGGSLQVNVAGAEVQENPISRRKGFLGRMRGLLRSRD